MKAGRVVGGELLEQNGVGHAALDVVVAGEGEAAQKLGLRDQDEVVILGEILEEQA
jgi:hypothetical protein